MSSEFNKSIIKKAQEHLKSLGYDVKTGHLYEVFSKLSGEDSWNVASIKQVSFLDKVIDPLKEDEEETVPFELWKKVSKKYIENWNSGLYTKDTVKLGVIVDEKNELVRSREVNMTREPNALFVGSMGSGKSVAMHSTVASFLKDNPEQALIFVADPLKGGTYFKELFNFPKVIPIIDSEIGLKHTLDLLINEAKARQKLFNNFGVDYIGEYEQKTGEKLDRCLLVLEEFQGFCFSRLNFYQDFKTEGTAAHSFYQLMRIGRSLGIWIMAASLDATQKSIPHEIMVNFTQKQVFKVSKVEAMQLLGSPEASEITYNQRGLCYTDYGKVQFPWFTEEEWKNNLKTVSKESKIYGAFLNNSIIEGLKSLVLRD